jgi:sigma-B regulation protein RsbU (phosphoserine phosphatase)
MGGDLFNIFPIDSEHSGFYVLDVSGHGVPAAMITVSVSQFLQQELANFQKNSQNHLFREPAMLLKALDTEFPFDRFNNFFTMTYLVINTITGDTVYSSAGHPFPVLLDRKGSIELLDKKGPVIGMSAFSMNADDGAEFEQGRLEINPGDRLFVFTDGIVEYQNPAGELFGDNRFYSILQEMKNESIHKIVDQCFGFLMEFGTNTKPQDDITLLGLELKN